MDKGIRCMIRRYAGDEVGATAVEYGLIIAMIVLAMVAVLGDMGGNLGRLFAKASGSL